MLHGHLAILYFDEVLEFDRRISRSVEVVKLAFRWPEPVLPILKSIERSEALSFAWYCVRSSTPVRTELTPLGDYTYCFGAPVLECRWANRSRRPVGYVQFRYNLLHELKPPAGEGDDGVWGPASPEFMRMIDVFKATFNELCYRLDRNTYVSKAYAARCFEEGDPPELILPLRK